MGFQRFCLVAAGTIFLAATAFVDRGHARPPFPPPPIFIPPPPPGIIVPVPPPPGVVIPVPAPAPVHVRIPAPPPIVLPAPPQLIMVPGTDVYYPPDIEEEIVFSQGYWWRPYDGRWYRARSYGGPWHHVVRSRVPAPIFGLPPGYRHEFYGGPRYHHREIERHWRSGGPRPAPHGIPRPAPHGGPPPGAPIYSPR